MAGFELDTDEVAAMATALNAVPPTPQPGTTARSASALADPFSGHGRPAGTGFGHREHAVPGRQRRGLRHPVGPHRPGHVDRDLDLVHDHPEQAREIVASGVDGRVDEQRLMNQWDDILGRIAGGFDVDVSW